MGRYDDIIGLERPVSRKHPSMPRADRAKQFMPFASLRGFDAVIDDRQTLRARRRRLSEDEREAMDERLRELAIALADGGRPEVSLSLFTKDPSRSDGPDEWGNYREITGRAEKLRPVERELKVDGIYYPLDRVDGIRMTGQ